MRAIVFDKERGTTRFLCYSNGEDYILGFHKIRAGYKPGDRVRDDDVEDEPFFALVFKNPKSITPMIKSLNWLYELATKRENAKDEEASE